MSNIPYRTALIVGAGSGISASVARALAASGLRVGLAARNIDKLASLAAEITAERFATDACDPAAVAQLFEAADKRLGEPHVVLYNASARAHGPIAALDPEAVRKAVEISAFGGFLVVREAARRMIDHGSGAILLTGASASIKGCQICQSPGGGSWFGRAIAGQEFSSASASCAAKGLAIDHSSPAASIHEYGRRSARRVEITQPQSPPRAPPDRAPPRSRSGRSLSYSRD
jgi:NADP-dependent 3-hydroxy acid dehydrogenase YdfG